ncbi:hypothetical protein SAMN05216557_11419 [Sphingomonas carotinifaciens]|uniref:Uncharacterized protein n=1 Tax=Sphingomonas carotinifaciens TaxID=1166323 RepID=A0A1G7RV19_9SPHN|nr:hypothetical protein [Sphingomonas carotinifaciens]SDG14049.1 hypothetical protein SAMN05216557_11419 [Sphingomonas carotinifaciens]
MSEDQFVRAAALIMGSAYYFGFDALMVAEGTDVRSHRD